MKTKDETITAMLAHIESECTAIDREEQFDRMLDECYSFESIGGPFGHMSPSSVLKECDPTAYRCGVNDWADGEGWVEINGSNYDGEEAEKAREEFIEELQSELSDLESRIEESEIETGDLEAQLEDGEGNALDVEAQIEASETETAGLKRELAELNAQIVECEQYAL